MSRALEKEKEAVAKKVDYFSVIEEIYEFCMKTGTKFVFVSGNGGSGKSTFAKNLKKHFEENGFSANLIDTDDFVTNTQVRKNSKVSYVDTEGNERSGSYTTSFAESYCVNGLNALIFNLKNKLDFYHIPKHVEKEDDYVLLSGNAEINIIEGVGTEFLEKQKNSLYVYINCDLKVETKRRISRARNGEDEQEFWQVYQKCEERRFQLKDKFLLKPIKFDLMLRSNEDFSFDVEQDVFNVLGESMNKDCDFAIKTIKQASALLVNDFETIEKGNGGDVVTSIDLNLEKFIISKVRQSYPDFDIISEEYSPQVALSDNCIIINGVDGSVNLSKSMPIFGIQLAIVRGGVNTASVVYLPFLNELYYCDENMAYLNGKLIHVRSCPVKNGLIAATGTERIKKMVALQKYGLMLRDYGSIAVAFAWVASGKLNGAIYNGDKIWNYYPVLKICEKAGAAIVDRKGEHIAASDEKFMDILEEKA